MRFSVLACVLGVGALGLGMRAMGAREDDEIFFDTVGYCKNPLAKFIEFHKLLLSQGFELTTARPKSEKSPAIAGTTSFWYHGPNQESPGYFVEVSVAPNSHPEFFTLGYYLYLNPGSQDKHYEQEKHLAVLIDKMHSLFEADY